MSAYMPLPPLHETSLLKVWGSPGRGRPDACVISAHGGATGTTFNIPPGVTLQFYSPHGQPALLAPENADILRIASIRFRTTQSDPSLHAVVLELVALGYKEIHCPFCRG